MKNDPANRFQEFKVRRICPITGKMVEMPILMIKRHFLLAQQAFKKHTGDRTLIPYLTDSEYRFLFEGISTSVPAPGAQEVTGPKLNRSYLATAFSSTALGRAARRIGVSVTQLSCGANCADLASKKTAQFFRTEPHTNHGNRLSSVVY